jgi:hypothetical protein
MELTAIRIDVGGKTRIIGKVGRVPDSCFYAPLRGHVVLYREVRYQDVYSFKTDTIGCDAAGWDTAKKLGATGMVCFTPDTNQLLLVSKEKMDNSFVLSLGELPQCRIKPFDMKIIMDAKKIDMGWTNIVVDAELLTTESFTQATHNPEQTKLFS